MTLARNAAPRSRFLVSNRIARGILLLALSSCATYTPSSNNPADLATIESGVFPVMGLANSEFISGTVTITVSAIDGVSRIMSPFQNDVASIDAGVHDITAVCELSVQSATRSDGKTSLQSSATFTINLVAGDSYRLVGQMAGPHLNSGIDVWIENVATGAIEHPPVRVNLL